MLAKSWKKILLLILIVACLFNVINKLINKASMEEEVEASARYIEEKQKNNN